MFTAPMVQALLRDVEPKTQTRRMFGLEQQNENPAEWSYLGVDARGDHEFIHCQSSGEITTVPCPYGSPGDRLWVKENLYRPDGDPWCYRADNQAVIADAEFETDMLVWAHHKQQDYCSSMFMPRWASRMLLDLTAVRVERVQVIGAADCAAEGVQIPVEKVQDPPVTGLLRISGKFPPIHYFPAGWGSQKHTIQENTEVWLRAHYASLWDSINHKKAPWSSNPWTWVLTFRRVEPVATANRLEQSQGSRVSEPVTQYKYVTKGGQLI